MLYEENVKKYLHPIYELALEAHIELIEDNALKRKYRTNRRGHQELCQIQLKGKLLGMD